MIENVGHSRVIAEVVVDPAREMIILDHLPRAIRRTICDAPYDYEVEAITEDYTRACAGAIFWDPPSPEDFSRHLISNFMNDVRRESTTGAENGKYWFKGIPEALTRRRSRATLRTASKYAIPKPRSNSK